MIKGFCDRECSTVVLSYDDKEEIMAGSMQKITSPEQFRSMVRNASSLEEIRKICAMVPKPSEEKRKRAYRIWRKASR